jgi:hypothetical protein
LEGIIVSDEEMVADIVDSGKQPKLFNILTKILKIINTENPLLGITGENDSNQVAKSLLPTIVHLGT